MIVNRGFMFGFLFMLLSSCLSDNNEVAGCQLQDKEIAIKSSEAQFKKKVIKNVSNYTKLKDFIINNLDTIFAYNEKDSYVITLHTFGKNDSVKNHIDHFAFFDYGTGNMIKDQVPPYLYPQLKKIYTAFNKNNFYSVNFERDSSVTISITNPSEYNSKDIGINHSLNWRNHKVNYITHGATNLSRDTTLANGWIYTVFIDCYQGI